MSFNAAVPLNSDSPSTFPGQNQTNMARLQAIIGADHQFNLTAAANDGYHNLIHLTLQAPSGALAATGRVYAKTVSGKVQLHYMDDLGNEYQITPAGATTISASVNFNGTGAVGAQTIRSQVNVSSVNKTATGLYTITFSTPFANTNYIVVVTGMRGTSGEVFGFIQSNGVYGDNVKVGSVNIGFQSSGGSNRDVLMGNVIIYSAA